MIPVQFWYHPKGRRIPELNWDFESPLPQHCNGLPTFASIYVFRNFRNVRSMYRLSHLSQHFLSFAKVLLRIV